MTTIDIPLRADGQFYLSPLQVDQKDSQVKLVNKTGQAVTIISPTPYSIEGQLKATLQISQYATLQLVQKEFFMVDGNLLIAPINLTLNTIPAANVIGGVLAYTVTMDLAKGNNAIPLPASFATNNAIPRQVTAQIDGAPQGVGYSTTFYGSPSTILNVTTNVALTQVTINIIGF